MNTNHAVLALIVLGLLAWIFLNNRKDGFNPFYYGPRRDPNEFKRHPFSTK
jgi:hypothetical protein